MRDREEKRLIDLGIKRDSYIYSQIDRWRERERIRDRQREKKGEKRVTEKDRERKRD